MGYGNYSVEAHKAITAARASSAQGAVFTESKCHPTLNPLGVRFRESRDSAEHPQSTAVIFALDVSGSMGDIPVQLATKTLPTFMESVVTVLPSPQVMFIAFGNAHADDSPLQVGQFESEAKLIDQWLARMHLEGGGGGLGESYDMAMYFASRHTKVDCLEKRKKKGYFIMTGDEPPFSLLDAGRLRAIVGDDVHEDIAIHDMARELCRSWNPFFLIPDPSRDAQFETGDTWRKVFHERVVVLPSPEDTAVAAALLIGIEERKLVDAGAIAKQLEVHFHKTGAARDALVTAVTPFAEAITRGPIAEAEVQGTRPYDPTPG